MNTKSGQNLTNLAREVRMKLQNKEVSNSLLESLYQSYNPIEDVSSFVQKALRIFPALNCGLASIYMHHIYPESIIIQGFYGNERHTFLAVQDNIILDITADQFGGPKVYVGPLRHPWQLH